MQTEDRLVFVSGNTRIIVMENYEALGRYVAAKEQADRFKDVRNNLLLQLKQQAERAGGQSGSTYPRTEFDAQKAREIVNQIDEAQRNLFTAIQEANLHADDCKKPKIEPFSR